MPRGFYDTRSFRTGSIGGKTVFNCQCCGRSTRMTTQDDDRYCGECYDLFGIQNTLWDDGVENFVKDGLVKARDQLLKKIVTRKGDPEAVKRQMRDLFAVEA
jgi:hypothetical protein